MALSAERVYFRLSGKAGKHQLTKQMLRSGVGLPAGASRCDPDGCTRARAAEKDHFAPPGGKWVSRKHMHTLGLHLQEDVRGQEDLPEGETFQKSSKSGLKDALKTQFEADKTAASIHKMVLWTALSVCRLTSGGGCLRGRLRRRAR